MKQLFSLLTISLLLFSCNDSGKNRKRLPTSGGTINALKVVMSNDLWKGEIGDATRAVFASPVYGLPQDEPQFELMQINKPTFLEHFKKSRIFVDIEIGKPKGVKFINDIYATPQIGVFITGKNNAEVLELLKTREQEMIKKIKEIELLEKQHQIELNPFDKEDVVNKNFNIDLSLLFNYRIAKMDKNFMWLRKNIKNGDMNLLIYNLPYNFIKNDSLAVTNIVKLRDSIGKKHIPGPTDGSYMITEKAYTPYFFNTTIDGKETLETKGIWDVKNDFMAGPFINYIINDKKNNRQLVFEGFTYKPQVTKRDYMFELEAIIKSVKTK